MIAPRTTTAASSLPRALAMLAHPILVGDLILELQRIDGDESALELLVAGIQEQVQPLLDRDGEVEVTARACLAVLLNGLGVQDLLAAVALAPDALGHLQLAILQGGARRLFAAEPAHGLAVTSVLRRPSAASPA